MIERDSKRCPKCGQTLPISAFNRSRPQPDHHAGWCAQCMVAVNRAWRAANPAYVAAYNTARRAAYVRRSQQARTIAALAR
jgi:hypothetical protein